MIVDCHTHVGLAGRHVGGAIHEDLMRTWGRPLWHVPLEEHWAASHADVTASLNHPDWINRHVPKHGMKVFDLTRKPDA